MKITITLHPEGLEGVVELPSREVVENRLGAAQDGTTLDRALEDLLARFDIPALVYDAKVEVAE